jgi:hypothetical protein
MAAEITGITQRNPVESMSDRALAEETLEHLRQLRDMLDEWSPVLGQFRVSGLLAVRRAARQAR